MNLSIKVFQYIFYYNWITADTVIGVLVIGVLVIGVLVIGVLVIGVLVQL